MWITLSFHWQFTPYVDAPSTKLLGLRTAAHQLKRVWAVVEMAL